MEEWDNHGQDVGISLDDCIPQDVFIRWNQRNTLFVYKYQIFIISVLFSGYFISASHTDTSDAQH